MFFTGKITTLHSPVSILTVVDKRTLLWISGEKPYFDDKLVILKVCAGLLIID